MTKDSAPVEYRIQYLPALDGLRALAVAAVMAYHLGLSGAPGGFLGVDVFFVLSGYLITSLLLAEWRRTGTINLRSFWVRRLRRLLPALGLILVALLIFAAFIPEFSTSALRGDIVSTLGYVANWRMAFSGASYFEQFEALSPLRHAWSLGIEEQWYLGWPIVLSVGLRLARGRAGRLVGPVILAAALSALAMAFLANAGNGEDPSRAYYGTDTRAQALLVGAALAAFLQERVLGRRAVAAVEWSAPIACIGLVLMVTRVSDADLWMYRGGFALVALLSAIVISGVVQTEPAGISLARLLSFPPLRFVGQISYGLYLWHWPVYLALTSSRTGWSGLSLSVLRVGATGLAATLSFFFVERPVRRGALHTLGVWRLRLGVPSLAAAILVASWFVPDPAVSPPVLTRATGTTAVAGDGFADGGFNVLLAGDSVALTLGFGAGGLTQRFKIRVTTEATLGCGIVRGRLHGEGRFKNRARTECEEWPSRWERAVRESSPDVSVLLVGAWELYDVERDGAVLRFGTPEHSRYLRDELNEAINVLSSTGARVALLTTPCFSQNDADLRGLGSERNDLQRVIRFNDLLREVVASRPSVELVDLYQFLCPGSRFVESSGTTRLRSDGVHLTPEGAALTWEWIRPHLEALRWT